jgi:hypothetical protein
MGECQSSSEIINTILCSNNSKTIITQTKQIMKRSASTICTISTCLCKQVIGDESINYGQLYGKYELRNDAFRWNNKDGEWRAIRSTNPCAKSNTWILTIH